MGRRLVQNPDGKLPPFNHVKLAHVISTPFVISFYNKSSRYESFGWRMLLWVNRNQAEGPMPAWIYPNILLKGLNIDVAEDIISTDAKYFQMSISHSRVIRPPVFKGLKGDAAVKYFISKCYFL